MRRSRVLAVLLAPALILAVLHAAPARPPAQDPSPQAPQKPVFRAGVNLVVVDAVVLDATNQPVADLEQRDFQVLEDGKPQDIVTFTRVALPALPPREPPRSDVATNAGAEEGRMILLVLDDPNSLSARTEAIKRAARRVVEQLASQDQVALLWVSLKRQGAREFTTDHASILRAIDAFQAEQARIVRRAGPNAQAELPDDPTGESAMSDESRKLARMNLKAFFDAERPFRVAEDVGRYLASAERRRKVIVYIGQGQRRQGLPGGSSGPGFQVDGSRPVSSGAAAFPPSAMDPLLPRAIAADRDANVTFYSIDPSGPPDPAHPDKANAPQAVGDFARLARATGGFVSFRTDVDQAVDRVVEATSIYYLLGYYAEPASGRERERAIEVRTTRTDVRVLARRSYMPEAPEASVSARDQAAGAVRDLVPTADLGLAAFAAPFRDAGRKEQAIEIAVEVRAPEFAPATRDAGFRDDVELVVVAIEPGEKVRATRQVTAHVALDAEKAAALGAGRYLLRTRLDVPPGQYQLRLGARSAVAGRAGSVYYDVTVPDFRARPLSLSGLVIGWATTRDPMPVASTDARASLVPFEPVLTREFAPDDKVWAYARVYRGRDAGGGTAFLTTSVIHLDDGKTAWTSSEERLPAAFGPSGETEYRVALPLDALQPGSYRLRIDAALDGTLAARRELDFRVTAAAPATPPTAEVAARAAAPPPAVLPPAVLRPPPAGLEELIDRTTEYVRDYAEELSSVVSEETYEQTVSGPPGFGHQAVMVEASRRLRSDFLLVRLPDEPGWTPFRDVFEVDGKPVRDRDDRLRKLFLEMPPGALTTARRILNESARYNIGRIVRNINQPVLPLMFLLPENQPRFWFRDGGEEMVESVRARRVSYEERSRPTLIRQLGSNKDMPASGTLWIDPVTGRIVKTELETTDGLFRMQTTVLYRPDDELGLWVPVEMRETYWSRSDRIYGKATYGNFRRFQVKTETTIKMPK